MKKLLLALATALPLASTGVLANDSPLIDLQGNLNVVEMTNEELSTVQGGAFDFCFACIATNTAIVTQVNIALFSVGALQSNASLVDQSNN